MVDTSVILEEKGPVCGRHFSYLRRKKANHVQSVSLVVTETDVGAKSPHGKLAHWPCAAVWEARPALTG